MMGDYETAPTRYAEAGQGSCRLMKRWRREKGCETLISCSHQPSLLRAVIPSWDNYLLGGLRQ